MPIAPERMTAASTITVTTDEEEGMHRDGGRSAPKRTVERFVRPDQTEFCIELAQVDDFRSKALARRFVVGGWR